MYNKGSMCAIINRNFLDVKVRYVCMLFVCKGSICVYDKVFYPGPKVYKIN